MDEERIIVNDNSGEGGVFKKADVRKFLDEKGRTDIDVEDIYKHHKLNSEFLAKHF